jgi:hypothetical protein
MTLHSALMLGTYFQIKRRPMRLNILKNWDFQGIIGKVMRPERFALLTSFALYFDCR